MVDLSEREFERLVCDGFAGTGWAVAASASYEPRSGLISDVLLAFVQLTQPDQWARLLASGRRDPAGDLVDATRDAIRSRGVADVMRRGVDVGDVTLRTVYFEPLSDHDPAQADRYRSNAFTLLRQVRHSAARAQTIDLVLFVNGLPVATVELKTPATGQSWLNAVAQYRRRNPSDAIFRPGTCIAHFAVDTDEVHVAPLLSGRETFFVPFNRGWEDGAGNPPTRLGFRVAYLWEEVLAPASLLEILSFFVTETGRGTPGHRIVFPRYHQLRAVRKLVADARENGPGRSYLLQHSAGSGKSNTIAWTAHRLVTIVGADGRRVFDTAIVITDRRALDIQLRETVLSFERQPGVVAVVSDDKARQLAAALSSGAQIVVTTLQTFPFVARHLEERTDRTYAVLIDEAHSSQTGSAAGEMDGVLAAPGDDAGEGDAEDLVNARVERQMLTRADMSNVSYVAFTATPKDRTVELFGTPAAEGGARRGPFDHYPMRQGIEEGFILDVLRNYTTHATYFRLLKAVEDDPAFDGRRAKAALADLVMADSATVALKARVVAGHFEAAVRERIGGAAKAMLVASSRLAAVRHVLALREELGRRGLPDRALVAFSGEVEDPRTGERHTEASLNGVPEARTAAEFGRTDSRILVVAQKFQTGFDQPLLHTMYVDKALDGVAAVQTLSRLNRTHPMKRDTMVLDFVNDAETIRSAFQRYYQSTILSEGADPSVLPRLLGEILSYGVFATPDVDRYASAYFTPGTTQDDLHAIVDPAVEAARSLAAESASTFRASVRRFVDLYSYLTHLLPSKDVELEKGYQFMRLLAAKLPARETGRPLADVAGSVRLDAVRVMESSSGALVLVDADGTFARRHPQAAPGTGEDAQALSEILRRLNEQHGGGLRDEDRLARFVEDAVGRMLLLSSFAASIDPAVNRSERNRRDAVREALGEVLEDMADTDREFYRAFHSDAGFADDIRRLVQDRLLPPIPPVT